MNSEIKVSVCIITYNHEKYIRKCLESVLSQEVNFKIEVIVADDFSTDATRNIIVEFENKYPGVVRKIFHSKNIGVCANYKSAHAAAQGAYIAHCDGDDFWMEGKLDAQVRLLDESPDVAQCWTCADIVNDGGHKIGLFPSRLARLIYPRYISTDDIVLSYALVGQHSTQLYRATARRKLDEDNFLDYLIAFNLSLKGKTIYLKEVLSAYRSTNSPSVTRNSNKNKASVDLLAVHLLQISEDYPAYARHAKANLVCRLFFSTLRGHNVILLKQSLARMSKVRLSPFLLLKSCFYFLLQKA